MELILHPHELKVGDYVFLSQLQRKRLNTNVKWVMVRHVHYSSPIRIHTNQGIIVVSKDRLFSVQRLIVERKWDSFSVYKEDYIKRRLVNYFDFIKQFKRGSYIDRDGNIRAMR